MNNLSGDIIQRPNRISGNLSSPTERIDAPFTEAKNAYQLAKMLDPTIGTLEEWIASLEGAPGENAQLLGVFASEQDLLSAYPQPPGESVWAFVSDSENPTILQVYRPTAGNWTVESFALPQVPIDTDPTLTADSDLVAPSQKAVKAYVDINLENLTPEDIGAQPAGDYATLDEAGKVPSSQLPSYVDDVREFANLAAFPPTGETGVIYVALDTGRTYRWSGSIYVEISSRPASTDEVQEGDTNLYYTDERAAAAAPVQTVNGQVGDVDLNYEDVGADPTGAAQAVQDNLNVVQNTAYTFLSSGLVTGGNLSINVDPTKFNVSAGYGYLVDYWTTPGTPVLTKVEWTQKTAQVTPYLNSAISTTVMLDIDGNLVFQIDPPSRSNYNRYLVLGKLLHPNRSTITGTSQYQHSASGSVGNGMDLMHFLGTLADGVVFSPNGANLQINRSGGRLLRIGGNYTTDKESPNITPIAQQQPTSFFYRYRDGAGGFKVDVPAVSNFVPNVYDDGSGTLATLQSSKYVNHRVYIFTSGNAYIVPGQTIYNHLADAVAALASEPFALDPQLADANLRTVITCRGGATALNNASDVLFTNGGIFGVIGGAAGASNIFTPGGVSFDLQYNNVGAFAGAAIDGLVKARAAVGPPVAAVAGEDYSAPGHTHVWSEVSKVGSTPADVGAGTVATSNYTFSDSPPASPQEKDIWVNTTTLQQFVRYGSVWVETSGAAVTPEAVGAALTSVTNIAGAKTLSGQLELSASQAATNPESAMSRALGDLRYYRRGLINMAFDTASSNWSAVTSGSGASAAYASGRIIVYSASTTQFGSCTVAPVSATGTQFNLSKQLGNGYGGIDFARYIEVEFSLFTHFNFELAKQNWAVVLSTATTAAGVAAMTPESGASYIAVVCIGGAITLQVCNNTTKSTSATLQTIGSGVNTLLFRMVNLGNGTVQLYIDEVLVGSLSGGQTGFVPAISNKFFLCATSSAVATTIPGSVIFGCPRLSWTP